MKASYAFQSLTFVASGVWNAARVCIASRGIGRAGAYVHLRICGWGSDLMNAHARIDWDKIGQVGLYTVPMAAKLLGENGTKIRSWIDGYPNSDAIPIIRRQLPPINGRTVLGFLDLIEARFIGHFDRFGLSPQSIRKVAEKLRERHKADHPFATNKRFRTDGKKIFMEIVETDEEKRVLNLMNDNFEMGPVIEASLFTSILYADDLAYRWRPVSELPLIVLDPKYAFGRPVLEGIWVPTDTLHDAYEVEGNTLRVAEDFEISEEAVNQAIAFEKRLRAGAGVENQAG